MDLVEPLWLLKQLYSNGSYYDAEKKWHLHHIPSTFSAKDLERLGKWGHSPNQMVLPGHNEVLSELQRLTSGWTLSEAANAFIAGLWSAPFLWQSALTAKLIALAMPMHAHVNYSDSSSVCAVCGFHVSAVDTTLLWYRRMTESTPLDGDPVGHVWALREMAALGKRPVPNEFDVWTFRAILTVIRSLPPKAKYSKAREALCREKLLPTSNKYAYGALLESLALIGVLDTKEYPGMATQFSTYKQRDRRPSVRVEAQVPLAWWDSSVGINEATLERVFTGMDCSLVSLTARPSEVPPRVKTVVGELEKRRAPRQAVSKSPDAGTGPAESGDVYAIRVRDGVWVTTYCHCIDGAYAVVEFLDGIYTEMPSKSQLKNAVRPRRDGRWQMKASRIDKTTGVRRVARNIPAPPSSMPEPDRIPGSGARDLKHLAHFCFPELNSQ